MQDFFFTHVLYQVKFPFPIVCQGIFFYQDLMLPYCQIQTEIEESREDPRPFRYDLNQIPYNYTVEVRNRFKGLDLIERLSEELWMEVCDIVQETGIETIPMEKKCKKAK